MTIALVGPQIVLPLLLQRPPLLLPLTTVIAILFSIERIEKERRTKWKQKYSKSKSRKRKLVVTNIIDNTDFSEIIHGTRATRRPLKSVYEKKTVSSGQQLTMKIRS